MQSTRVTRWMCTATIETVIRVKRHFVPYDTVCALRHTATEITVRRHFLSGKTVCALRHTATEITARRHFLSGNTVCALRHTATEIKAETRSFGWQSVVSSNKIFGDLLRQFVADLTGKKSFRASGDRRLTLPQELSKALWSLKNVNAESLVTASRFRNLQSSELNEDLTV